MSREKPPMSLDDLDALVARTEQAYVEEPNGSGVGYIIEADDFEVVVDKG